MGLIVIFTIDPHHFPLRCEIAAVTQHSITCRLLSLLRSSGVTWSSTGYEVTTFLLNRFPDACAEQQTLEAVSYSPTKEGPTVFWNAKFHYPVY
jgi:hypothetical protein